MGRAGESWEASQDPRILAGLPAEEESITHLAQTPLAHPNLAWW